MKPFSVLFEEQGAKVIEYNGRIVFSCLRCTKANNYLIRIRNVRANSDEQQIICISTSFQGTITINGEKIKKKKGVFSRISIFEKEINGEIMINLELIDGIFIIYNASIPNNSESTRSMVFGCALSPIEMSDGWYRICCNDYENDDDFDDLIFEMKVEINDRVIDIIEEWQPRY